MMIPAPQNVSTALCTITKGSRLEQTKGSFPRKKTLWQMAFRTVMLMIVVSGLSFKGLAQSTGDYRSRATGTWATASNWDTYNGSAWVVASTAPSSASGVITILASHTITIGTAATIDQVVVQAGGQLNLSPSGNNSITIADGAGTDITVFGKLMFTSGSLTRNGTISFESGSEYEQTKGTEPIPTATWNSNSTCHINISITNNACVHQKFQIIGTPKI